MKLNIKKLQKAGTIPLKQDYQFYKGQYNSELKKKIEARAEANKPVNTTSEFIYDLKTKRSIPNPNAKMGLEIVSPEFQLMTAGVGSLGTKAVSTTGKIGQTMLHGAGQGAMANMSNLSGSEQSASGLAQDVLGGAVVGGVLKGVGLGAKPLGKYALQKAEPYLMGDKNIPMMGGYKPKMNVVDETIRTQPTIRDATLNILKGSLEARNFINSDAVTSTLEKNNLLANRLGIQNNPNIYKQKPYLQSRLVENFDDKVGKTNIPTGNTNSIGALFDPNNNEMLFKISVTPSVSYHETLHSYGYGKKQIQDFKAKYLFDSEKIKKLDDLSKNYYLSGNEAAVQFSQLGRDYGLKPGQKFPGWRAMEDMIDQPGPGLAGSPYYAKLSTPRDYKRVWDAMTGKYFVVPTAVATTGYGLTQSQRKGGKLVVIGRK